MLSHGEDKPPSRRMKRFWKVAVLANIKDESKPKPEGVPPDAYADYDHIETIDALRAAIETDGHQTVFIQADEDLSFALKEEEPPAVVELDVFLEHILRSRVIHDLTDHHSVDAGRGPTFVNG